jgi:hypothetical protein
MSTIPARKTRSRLSETNPHTAAAAIPSPAAEIMPATARARRSSTDERLTSPPIEVGIDAGAIQSHASATIVTRATAASRVITFPMPIVRASRASTRLSMSPLSMCGSLTTSSSMMLTRHSPNQSANLARRAAPQTTKQASLTSWNRCLGTLRLRDVSSTPSHEDPAARDSGRL